MVPSVTEGRIQLFKYAHGYQANWQQLQCNDRSVEGKNGGAFAGQPEGLHSACLQTFWPPEVKAIRFSYSLKLTAYKKSLSMVNSDKCPTVWGSCSLTAHCIFSLLFVPALTFMFHGAESRPESISKTSETSKTMNKDKVSSFPAACDTDKLFFLQHNCYLVLVVF